jgi:hypothetical protein
MSARQPKTPKLNLRSRRGSASMVISVISSSRTVTDDDVPT